MKIPPLDAAKRDREFPAAIRVLLYFLDELEPDEFKERKVSVIALELDIPERTVERAIAQLLNRGYITAGKRAPGSPQTYKLRWKPKRKAA